MKNYNAIIIYATAEDAEAILKQAERLLRSHWNLHGFKRIGSGYQTITTDGFGNPFGDEREMRLFGIAIEVPEHMNYRMVMAHLEYGNHKVGCYAEYYFTNI